MLVLNLPFPPSVNTYYRRGAHATYMSKAGREFKAKVSEYVIESKAPKLGAERLHITIVLRTKDKRKYDIDNRVKAILDSLQDAGVFDDDEQVDRLDVIRGEPIKGGKALVLIEYGEELV